MMKRTNRILGIYNADNQLLCGICMEKAVLNDKGTGFEGHDHSKVQIQMAYDEGRAVKDNDPQLLTKLEA